MHVPKQTFCQLKHNTNTVVNITKDKCQFFSSAQEDFFNY